MLVLEIGEREASGNVSLLLLEVLLLITLAKIMTIEPLVEGRPTPLPSFLLLILKGIGLLILVALKSVERHKPPDGLMKN